MNTLPIDIAQHIFKKACLMDLKPRDCTLGFKFDDVEFEWTRELVMDLKKEFLDLINYHYERSYNRLTNKVSKMVEEDIGAWEWYPGLDQELFDDYMNIFESEIIPTFFVKIGDSPKLHEMLLEPTGFYPSESYNFNTLKNLTQALSDIYDDDYLREYVKNKFIEV